jgi:hypothetical protein
MHFEFGSISTKTGTAPNLSIAVAPEEKLNEGNITSSPGCNSASMLAISKA